MVRVRAALALVSSLVAFASSAEAPRCSIAHVERWREYRSPHFAVTTDVSPGTAADLVAQLETLYALVVQALFGQQVEIPGHVRVVAFGDPRQFQKMARENAGGYVKRTQEGLTIVLPFEGHEPLSRTVAHELVHHVSWFLFPRQQHWFAEGLAQFIETVATERYDEIPTGTHISRAGRHGGRWAGGAPVDMIRATKGGLVPVRSLFEWNGATDKPDSERQYLTSWLLYHWLWNERSRQLVAYQERLSRGDSPADAWRSAFPEFDLASPAASAKLDEELERYRRLGRYLSYRVDVAKQDVRVTDAPVAPADLHMILLDARMRWPDDTKTASALVRAEVEEALREDPFQPHAIQARARALGKRGAEELRAAVAARPGDGRAWLALGDALDGKADAREKEAALRKAVELSPESAWANNDLAWLLVTSGRARESRPFADRALDLAPWDGAIVDTLAAVAIGIGQCKAAVQLERRAADLYDVDQAAGAQLRARLAQYEARCGAEAPKPR